MWSDQDGAASHVVDDGTVVRLLGVPGSARAADALAAGKVVVRSGHDLRPDGSVHVAVHDNGVGEGSVEVASGDFPAVVVDLQNRDQLGLVLPPSVAARLGVTMKRYGGRIADPTWVTAIPWPALVAVVVGVPLATMAGARLLTRSQLPMVRRVVG